MADAQTVVPPEDAAATVAPADFSERFNAAALPPDTLPSTEMFGTPEAMATAVPRAAAALSGYNILRFFGEFGKGVYEGTMTPQEQIENSFWAALSSLDIGKFAAPKEVLAAHQAFHDEVIAPAADRSAARLTIPLDERNIAPEPGVAPGVSAAAIQEENLQRVARGEPQISVPVSSAKIEQQVNQLEEARDLGIIGPERIPQPDDTPAQAAQRAIPASRFVDPNDKITMTVGGEPIDAYQQRFSEWVSKIKHPGDIDNIIARTASEENYFPQAREGEIPAAHIEQLAQASGFDSKKFDPALLREKFASDDEFRAVMQTMLQTRDDYRTAIERMKTDRSPENLDAAIAARNRHRIALEYVAAFRSDWGKAGLAQQEFLRLEKRREQYSERDANGVPKEPNDLIAATEEFAHAPSKAGLEGLIAAAEKAVDAAKPKEGVVAAAPKEPPPAGVSDLLSSAESVLKRLKSGDKRTALDRLVAAADRAAGPQKVKVQRAIADQLPPDLQALVDKAEYVTQRFGGIDREAAEIKAEAEATNGLPKEGVSYVLGKAYEMMNRRGAFSFDTLFWLRNNWLLSGWLTHSFYFVVNAASLVKDHVLDPFTAALYDRIRGGRNNFFGEVVAGPLGATLATPAALRTAITAARTGGRVPLEAELRLAERGEPSPQASRMSSQYLNYSSPDWGALKTAADWLGVPMVVRNAAELAAGGFAGRFANIQHSMFRELGAGAQAHRNAYAAAAKEGSLLGNPMEFAERYKYHLDNPTDDVLRDNVNGGFRGTFLEKLGPATRRLASALKATPLRWEFPFMHVPINIQRRGMEMSPVAFAGPEMRANLFGRNGARTQATAIASMVNGIALMSYITYLYTQGKVTGDPPPPGTPEAQRWKELNIQPNSIMIGDEWVSTNRFGPARTPIALGALLGDIIHHYDTSNATDEEMAKVTGKAIVGTVKVISNEVGMLALHNTFEAMNGERGMARYGAETARSFMPYNVGLAQTAAYNDPYVRDIKGFKDGLKYGIPGLRETLPPKRDAIYGEPLPNPAYKSFVRTVPVTVDPVKQELDRIGYHPGPPDRVLTLDKTKIKLDPEQYDKYEATAGQQVKQYLNLRMRLPDWQGLSLEEKNNQARALVKRGRADARKGMLVDDLSLVGQALMQRHNQISGQ